MFAKKHAAKTASLAAAGAALALMLAAAAPARAADVRCACAEAIRPILAELGPKFEQATGHKLVITYGLAPVVMKRIEGGDAFDIAIINPPQVDTLIKQGKIAQDARANLGRAGVGVAVRAGAPKPDISSVDAFKRTLLSSKSVAFPDEGTSGAYFRGVLDRMQIADQMKDKVKPAAAGAGFGMVARGEAELMVTIIPQLLANPGIEVAGPVPAELQTWIGVAAGVGAGAKEPQAAKALIAFLTTPAAMAVMKAKGWEAMP
jgi:molybdate transport system substrate-binding protein